MHNYRKLVAALVGLTVLLLNRQYGVDLLGTEALLVDLIVSAGTATAVWWYRNDPQVD